MEQQTCPVCGNTIPEAAKACPVDGFPVPVVDAEPPVGETDAAYRAFEREQPAPKPFIEGDWT